MDASQLRDALAAQPQSDATVGDRARRGLADYFGGFDQLRDALGAQLSTPEGFGEAAAYATPGVGQALSARDAYNALGDRDWRGAALGAVGMIPFMGGMTKSSAKLADALANSEKAGIRAYHGSPHDFDAFDLSKIGTGEGAQAYGHGLYFAENEGVAKDYRDKLSRQVDYSGAPIASQHPMDSPAAQATHAVGARIANGEAPEKVIADEAENWRATADLYRTAVDESPEASAEAHRTAAHFDSVADAISKLDPKAFNKNPGHMYEVNINADPEHFLDWDKPLHSQSDHVKNALLGTPGFSDSVGAQTMNGPVTKYTPSFGDLSQRGLVPGTYDRASPEFSKTYLDAGIPGVKYLDQGSRAAGEGSRNYVVFDDKLVNIVRKYGIPGAIGLGLITPEIGRQMQEQGL